MLLFGVMATHSATVSNRAAAVHVFIVEERGLGQSMGQYKKFWPRTWPTLGPPLGPPNAGFGPPFGPGEESFVEKCSGVSGQSSV